MEDTQLYPLSFIRSCQDDYSYTAEPAYRVTYPTAPAYGSGYYVTYNRLFIIAKLHPTNRWGIHPTARLAGRYPNTLAAFDECNLQREMFYLRRDAVNATKQFLDSMESVS